MSAKLMQELRCVLDYETRSAANLEKLGAPGYAKHHSTSIFCVSYKINDGPTKLWIPERSPMPADLWECFKRGILVAHNAAFEIAITKYVLTRYPYLTAEQRERLANLPSSVWRCTAAKAAACSLPRKLEMAAKVLNLPTQKDMTGNRLIKKYSKPRKPSKKDPSPWWHDKNDLRRIYSYCIDDSQSEYELDQALPDLTPYEQKVWELDRTINERGVLIDIPTVKIILQLVQMEVANITRKVQTLSDGTIESATQVAKVLKWVNARGAKLSNLKAETIRDKLLEDGLPVEVKRMLEYRQGSSKTSTGKYIAMLHAVDEDHRARELLLYNGTVPTARWAGRRIQPHNFPRPTVKDFNVDEAIELIKANDVWGPKVTLKAIRKRYGKTKVMDVLSSATRGMIISSPGTDLFCADFSSVEARVAFWLAEHKDGIDGFKHNRKLYEEMAAATFDMDIKWLCTKEGKDSLERFVGKESVLGCQYGMGWLKFMNQCHKKGMKKVTPEIAKKAVYTYREVHSPIPRLWKLLETAAMQAIRNPGKRFRVTKVVFYMSGNYLCIKLPSGRRLRYFKPRIKAKQLASGRMVPSIYYWLQDPKIHQWVERPIWGGIFTNHCVQGISRDLMVCGVFNIENAGYRFLLSVHDEGLSERKKGLGDLSEYLKLMTKLPDWAKELPLTAEGWKGPRYRKG